MDFFCLTIIMVSLIFIISTVIKVIFFYKKPHPLFRKEIKRKTVLHVHDAENACNVGDKVEIMATRPLSRLKRWRVVRILEKAQA